MEPPRYMVVRRTQRTLTSRVVTEVLFRDLTLEQASRELVALMITQREHGTYAVEEQR